MANYPEHPTLDECLYFEDYVTERLDKPSFADLMEDYLRFAECYGRWWSYKDLSRIPHPRGLSKKYVRETIRRCEWIADSTESLLAHAKKLFPKMISSGFDSVVANAGYVQRGIADMEDYLAKRKATLCGIGLVA